MEGSVIRGDAHGVGGEETVQPVRDTVMPSTCTGLPGIRKSPGSDPEPPEATGRGRGEAW